MSGKTTIILDPDFSSDEVTVSLDTLHTVKSKYFHQYFNILLTYIWLLTLGFRTPLLSL